MKILISTLNSKFTHSSLAIMSIKKFSTIYNEQYNDHIFLKEFTINHHDEYIVSNIFKENPDIICFSCYIWNIDKTKQIISVLKKILPHVKIILGGPEVSFDYEELIERSIADIIVIGEGEQTFFELMQYFLEDGNTTLHSIKSIAFLDEGVCVSTQKRPALSLDAIPFPYTSEDLNYLKDRIIYYESSRGCPFECAYCLSSIDRGVRFLSLQRTYSDLRFFLDEKMPKVKFIDRTFNCNAERTEKIWRFLIENDNGITCFHFEVCADILTDKLLDCLKYAREGLFQFEIGVQSTNPRTLDEIRRNTNFEKLSDFVVKIRKLNNIHLHLDLIAGLPLEDLESFGRSFDDVYFLNPHKLQLGFLKLLKGSYLHDNADFFGIVCEDKSPYTVLYTKDMSFADICKLREIEKVLDIFYNSKKFYYTLKFVLDNVSSPFQFYLEYSEYLEAKRFFDMPHSSIALYDIFFQYCSESLYDQIDIIKELLIFDLYRIDKVTKLPSFIEKRDTLIRQQGRSHHVQQFYYNVLNWIENDFKRILKEETVVLFTYNKSEKGYASFKKVESK